MSVRERDPHSGHMTTGHEWNGIKELNTSVPRVVWTCLISSFVISLVMWILWPTWPIWSTFTPGVLKVDERVLLAEEMQAVADKRKQIDQDLEAVTYEGLKEKPELLSQVRADGHLLFQDNCAACHGVDGKGGNGFPNLSDKSWLWGGDEEAILETLKVGINDKHPDTRTAQMLAFGRDGLLDRGTIKDVIAYLVSIQEKPQQLSKAYGNIENGKTAFEENCSSCHGDDAAGDADAGAPNLVDEAWIYGGDTKALFETIWNGRAGHMPAWQGRLTAAQRTILALYVIDIGVMAKGSSK